MQINNESAIKFYEHFGFEIVERKDNYYKRIEPADAFVLQKTFRKTDTVVNGDVSKEQADKTEKTDKKESWYWKKI